MIDLAVEGHPVAQGSMNVGRHGKVYQARDVREWRTQIAQTVTREVVLEDLLRGPVGIDLQFTLERPRRAQQDFPVVTPDLDKLSRAVLDALTGIVYDDDKRVVSLQAQKRYGEVPGVRIQVKEVQRCDL